jgi:hypothetical protein
MDNVIIGFSDRKKGEVIKEILVSGGFYNTDICVSGDEILRCASHSGGGIVVCGYKVGTQLYREIYEMLDGNFGMLVILSRNQAELVDDEDIFTLVLPVGKGDIIKTIGVILSIGRKNPYDDIKNISDETGQKPQRSDDDKVVIEKAKLYLMNKYKLSEDAAHRFLQKNSMNKGLRMVDTARIILRDR